ncbi:hypothetical protein E0K83_02140 [Gramella sp. BOM4]|nr:hypothetical protein [Christiangramia bathymodioli]
MKIKISLLGILLISYFQVFSQVEFSGSLNLQGYYSNKEKLPFWFYSNQRGRVSEETNIAGWISGKMNYKVSNKASLEIGGGLLYQDDYLNKDYIDELYADFKYSWLQVIVGRKQEPEVYNGLSATNENFAWSLNARPMPGIQIQTSKPVYLNENNKWGFEFSWEEYLMGNDRYVKGTRLHSKSLYLVYRPDDSWHLKGGIKHFAQWGGDSPNLGPQADGIEDYLRVITGRKGGEDANESDQINVAGSQLGTYELYVSRSFSGFNLKFIYNHFFEDGTGSRFANFPDGRYGVFLENMDKNGIIQNWIYEFFYTKNQSQNSSAPHKNDYYFWNGIYRSGWTYQNRIIGLPFFDFNEDIPLIVGNKFIAHHTGVSGNLKFDGNYTMPYRFMASFVKKEGTLSSEYKPHREEVYLKYEMDLINNPFNLKIILGSEYSNISKPVYGTGISLAKNF